MVSSDGYIRLNTQGYTWPILSTWFDRPFIISRKSYVKSKSPFSANICLIDIEDPILIIPNVAFIF